jgi:hypothetical protein
VIRPSGFPTSALESVLIRRETTLKPIKNIEVKKKGIALSDVSQLPFPLNLSLYTAESTSHLLNGINVISCLSYQGPDSKNVVLSKYEEGRKARSREREEKDGGKLVDIHCNDSSGQLKTNKKLMSKFPLLRGYYYHVALNEKKESVIEYYLSKGLVDVNCPYVRK